MGGSYGNTASVQYSACNAIGQVPSRAHGYHKGGALPDHVRHGHRRYNMSCPIPFRSPPTGWHNDERRSRAPSLLPLPRARLWSQQLSGPPDSPSQVARTPSSSWGGAPGTLDVPDRRQGRRTGSRSRRGHQEPRVVDGAGDGQATRAQHLKQRYESVGFSMSCTDMASGVRRRTQRPMKTAAMSGGGWPGDDGGEKRSLVGRR